MRFSDCGLGDASVCTSAPGYFEPGCGVPVAWHGDILDKSSYDSAIPRYTGVRV
jgi:hypothetical protein